MCFLFLFFFFLFFGQGLFYNLSATERGVQRTKGDGSCGGDLYSVLRVVGAGGSSHDDYYSLSYGMLKIARSDRDKG